MIKIVIRCTNILRTQDLITELIMRDVQTWSDTVNKKTLFDLRPLTSYNETYRFAQA